MRLRSFCFLYPILVAASLLPVLLSCGGGKPKTVHNTPDPVIESFRVEPATITVGDEAALVPTFREGIGRITAQGQPVMNGNSETIGSGARVKVSPKETTAYTLTVTNGNPAADKRQDVTVTVLPKPQEPVIEVGSDDIGPYVTSGNEIKASVEEQPGCTYQWTIGDKGTLKGTSTGSQITVIATELGVIPVKCVVSNGAGGTAEDSETINVVARPLAPQIIVDPTMKDNEKKEAKVAAPLDGITYIWDIQNGEILSGKQGNRIQFKPDEDVKSCTLICGARNEAWTESRQTARVTVEPQPAVITKALEVADIHFDPRKGTTLMAEFTGKGVINPGNLPIESGKPLVVKPFHPMLYELKITKSVGQPLIERVPVYPAQILAVGEEHTVARLADGTVRAWGHDHLGQLGNRRPLDNANVKDKTCCLNVMPVLEAGNAINDVSLVAAGSFHSLGFKQGVLWAWGHNFAGQLGDGKTTPRSVAAPMNSKEPFNNVRMIAAGYAHNLVLDENGLHGCGWNENGQLGGDPTKNIWPEFVRLALKDPDTQKELDTKDVVAVSGGGRHTLLLKKDGTVFTMGSYEWKPEEETLLSKLNASGPKPVGKLENIVAIASGHMHALALQNDGTVWAWGDNRFGSLGNGKMPEHSVQPVKVEGLDHVVAIATGYWHSFAMKSDGTIWGWGHNNLAQVDGSLQSIAQRVQFTALTNVVALAMGNEHSVALKSDGTVHTWGSNEYGQSGNYQWIAETVSLPVQSGDSFYGEGIVTVENLNDGDAGLMMCFHSKDLVLGWSEGIKDTPSTPGMPSRMKNGGPLKLANKGTVPAHSDASLEKWAKLYFELPATGGTKATITNIWFNEGSGPNYEGKNLWDKGDIVIEVPKAQIAPLPAAMEVSGSWVPLAL